MLCDQCKKREATTYFSQTINGKTTEKHLCAQCAMEAGLNKLSLFGWGLDPDFSFALPTAKACPTCATTLADIRQTGMLGCPHCYDAFRDELLPMIRRTHGNVRHKAGDEPKKVKQPAPSEKEKLEAELKEAVAAENFEKAAELRDRIRALKEEQK